MKNSPVARALLLSAMTLTATVAVRAQTAYIVFQRDDKIWRVEVTENAVPEQLTCGIDVDGEPSILPPGRWIYYNRLTSAGNRDIYRIQSNGSGPAEQVTSSLFDDYDPDAGENGIQSFVYFVSTRDNFPDSDIWKIGVNPLSAPVNVTQNGTTAEPCYEADPGWCGTNQIVYSKRDSPFCGNTSETDDEIWIINNDGTNPQPLTDNFQANPPLPGVFINDRYPACRPNNANFVAFDRSGEHSRMTIIELNRTPDPDVETNLTLGGFVAGDDEGVTYSPGGTAIAFRHEDPDPDKTGIWTRTLGMLPVYARRTFELSDEHPDWGELTTVSAVGCN